MTDIGIFQIILYLFVLLILVKPLGWYMAQVYSERSLPMVDTILSPIENFLYRICHIKTHQPMDWKRYLFSMLFLNLFSFLSVYILQRLQFFLPLNFENFPAPSPHLAFNTAISFATNTNWQSYSGETTMSYLTQMMAFTVQNFISAATGMSLLIALIRGIVNHENTALGNFWVDTIRGILYILLPLSIIFSILLVSQGVIQNFKPNQKIELLEPFKYQIPSVDSVDPKDQLLNNAADNNVKNPKIETKNQLQQTIPMGPVASQIAIK